uniref:Uncharacterized protein n=1 Tax=Anopheles atroparvus TaxID=41427 RepID=A0A182IXL0_ANOAO
MTRHPCPLTQALALTRTKSPKKESSVPASPSHTGGRESEVASPKAPSGATVNVSSASSNSSSAEPPAERAHSTSPDAGNSSSNVNHVHGADSAASSNGALDGSSSATTSAQASVRDLGAALHPAISVSQSLLAAAASVSRSVTPRISVSTSLTGPENGPSAGNGAGVHPGTSGRDSVSRAVAALQSNSSNGPNVDRAILQSPVNVSLTPFRTWLACSRGDVNDRSVLADLNRSTRTYRAARKSSRKSKRSNCNFYEPEQRMEQSTVIRMV